MSDHPPENVPQTGSVSGESASTPSGALPSVAIVGRPNVGKSTLLNRVLGRRAAIVEERPGVTRDRKEVEVTWNGRRMLLVDTGGWMSGGDSLDDKVTEQSERAMREAELALFVVDSSVGLVEEDAQIAARLRRLNDAVIVVANKVDDQRHEDRIWEFMSLGFDEPMAISALHGRGSGDLLDVVVGRLEAAGAFEDDDVSMGPSTAPDGELFAVALVGRPNVGKSTLFNRLIDDDRSVVHDMAGTTRDSVDTVVETELGSVRFIDTAGMRRKTRIREGTEWYSTLRALQSVDGADVALLVIDATEGVTHQDQRLAERVDAAGCPILVVLNKWDVMTSDQKERTEYQLRTRLHFLSESAVLRTSALSGKGVHRILPALGEAISVYRTRIPTRRVNEAIRAAQQAQPAPHGARILYATQGATDPPTFTLFVSKDVPASYLRYIERTLRDEFQLGATPIKLRVRRRGS